MRTWPAQCSIGFVFLSLVFMAALQPAQVLLLLIVILLAVLAAGVALYLIWGRGGPKQ